MINQLGLNLLERLALRVLVRSRRIGLLVLKPHGSRMVYVARETSDPVNILTDEPASMQFERIYHQPAYGELE